MLVTSPQSWTADGGITGTVGLVGGGNFRASSTRVMVGMAISFPAGHLIWNLGNGDFLFSFNTPIAGVGMAVQADLFGPFTKATLFAYDTLSNLLGI